MKQKILTLALSSTLVLGACASHPDKIAAASVSTLQYQDYNCKQIGAEVARINDDLIDLYGRLDKKASNDSAQMAVGMILFWPTLFFLEGGDGVEASEYSKLKGEMEALETVAIKKECGIEFPEPPKVEKQAPKKETGPND
jgi:hypothetical protein